MVQDIIPAAWLPENTKPALWPVLVLFKLCRGKLPFSVFIQKKKEGGAGRSLNRDILLFFYGQVNTYLTQFGGSE